MLYIDINVVLRADMLRNLLNLNIPGYAVYHPPVLAENRKNTKRARERKSRKPAILACVLFLTGCFATR
jgi:hypothetical protein